VCQVVNFKEYGSVDALNQAFGDGWLYIGRANRYGGLPESPLANPYKARDYGRAAPCPQGPPWATTGAGYGSESRRATRPSWQR
jgi:hypothetical protein